MRGRNRLTIPLKPGYVVAGAAWVSVLVTFPAWWLASLLPVP
jgi:hypothetical protein